MACREQVAPSAARPVATPLARSTAATFVGREACKGCHAGEYERWKGSHHDLAMQEVTDETVLGDFGSRTFTHFGVTSTFYKRDGKYFVKTDGPDGKLHDYPIAYTFGVYPLQQYLIAFPGGRYQALNVVWDTRPKKDGGQRWFHLYPKEAVPARRPPPLDGAVPELELHVRRVPLDEREERISRRREALRNHVFRDRRLLRGLPRAGLGARGLGESGRGRPGEEG